MTIDAWPASSTRARGVVRRFLAIGALALGLVGCGTFAHPATGAPFIDPDILGTWQVPAHDDDPGGTVVLTTDDRGVHLNAAVHESGKPDGKTQTYRVELATIAGSTYASIFIPDQSKEDAGFNWLIVRYKRMGETLVVSRLDDAALLTALGKGELQGHAAGTADFPVPKISSDSATVDAFLQAHGETAFKTGLDDTVTLTRLAPQ